MKKRILLICALLVSVITLSGAANVITFKTSKKIGETVKLHMQYEGATPTLSGLDGIPQNNKEVTYKLTSQTVTITGDVTYFDCFENQITSLDISKNTALTTLDCQRNQLTALDVSKNTALTTLVCAENQLTALDVSKNTELVSLKCHSNKLTALNLSKNNTALTELSCSHNQLTALDVSQNTALTGLGCSDNKLKALDVSKNTALTGLYCYNNQLTELDVSYNTALETLVCHDNQLTALDLSKNTELTFLNCSANPFTKLDISNNTALNTLYCKNNKLTALDVSKNTVLTELHCPDNQLAALDLSKNTALTRLDCSDNKLTVLNPSKNTALTNLDCANNQLTELDLSKNTALFRLDCSNNKLTVLDVSNTALPELHCYGNQIKGKEMTRLVNSLPDRNGKCPGEFVVVQEPNPEGNQCSTTNVAIAKGKNWNTKKINSESLITSDYKGTTNVISFTTAKAVGETVELEMEYTGDAPTLTGLTGTPQSGKKYVTYTLTAQEVTITGDVTKFFCASNQLTALDLSKNSALEKLDCSNNQLTALDLSQNSALVSLNCSGIQLTALDVTQNTALTWLFCEENQLKALDLSKNTNLKTLFCSENQLTALDVSKNTALTNLECYDNQLTELDVSKNTVLDALSCYQNKLTTLDVSKNTALTSFECFGNQLTALDISQNTMLTYLNCRENLLKALDVSQNTALTEVYCNTNQIKVGEMIRLVNSLPDLTGMEAGIFVVIQEPEPEGNRCLKKDVAIAKGKNWNTQKYKSDTDEYVPYEGEEPIPYAVTLTKEGEGTITATGADDLNAVLEGTELTIVATPADGYELASLTANGVHIYATKKFIVTAATEVKAIFDKKTYGVELTKEGEGTLTATGADDFRSVPEGTELTIEATPAAGYELTALTANDTDILATKKFTVTADTEVKAIFTKKTAADVVESSSVHLYPNPTGTYVNVKGAKADALVRLYDANGTLRYEARTDADGTLQIDLSAYAEGTYLLRVGNDAQRLLIQR